MEDKGPGIPYRFRHHIVALAVFSISLALLTATLGDPGLTWDEPAYLHSARGDIRTFGPPSDSADAYHRRCGVLPWLERIARSRDLSEARRFFTRDEILRAWDYNRYGPNFHPPLSGLLAIAGHLASRPWLDEIPSWRFASAVELSAAVALAYLAVGSLGGFWPGFMAAGALLFTPRVFGHGHIFGTDTPTLFIWVIAALLFWAGRRRRVARIFFGVACGLAFLTKLNACAVAVPVALWVFAEVAAGLRRCPVRLALATALLVLAVAPLAVAFHEIRRQAGIIRLQTKYELLQRAATRAGLAHLLPTVPPRSERDVERLADTLLETHLANRGLPPGKAATAQGRTRKELADAVGLPELDLDSYLAYVWADRLQIPAALPKWVLLLPTVSLAVWLVLFRRVTDPAIATLEMLVSACALAPVVAIAFNPTWWFDTYTQLALYYLVSAGRQGALPEIEIFYLGHKYVYSLPWHNGFVLAAVTLPVGVSIWCLIGCVAGWKAPRWRPFVIYSMLHALTLPVIRMFPVPAHDGVRLMLPTFWFVAVLAGVGLGGFCTLLRKFEAGTWQFHAAAALVTALSIGPAAVGLWQIHPFELSYYNVVVGGLPGACRAGFETTYWYDAVTDDVLQRMNDPRRGLPPDAILHPPSPASNAPVFDELQALGKLRQDIRVGAAPRDGFPYMHLLTHSAKSTVFSRFLYSLTPLLEQNWKDVKLFSVYPPDQVGRAFALTLLCRVPGAQPDRLDTELLRIATEEPGALMEAALLVAHHGADAAAQQAASRRSSVRHVVAKLMEQRADLERLLALSPDALAGAAELIIDNAGWRPEVFRTIVEYPGYLPVPDLGGYLDSPHPPGARPARRDASPD